MVRFRGDKLGCRGMDGTGARTTGIYAHGKTSRTWKDNSRPNAYVSRTRMEHRVGHGCRPARTPESSRRREAIQGRSFPRGARLGGNATPFAHWPKLLPQAVQAGRVRKIAGAGCPTAAALDRAR